MDKPPSVHKLRMLLCVCYRLGRCIIPNSQTCRWGGGPGGAPPTRVVIAIASPTAVEVWPKVYKRIAGRGFAFLLAAG